MYKGKPISNLPKLTNIRAVFLGVLIGYACALAFGGDQCPTPPPPPPPQVSDCRSVTLQLETALSALDTCEGLSAAAATATVNTAPAAAAASSKNHGQMQNQGIWPLLREYGCGHENLDTPHLLSGNHVEGAGRMVVDVGLEDGQETFDAVDKGFVVFGFELNFGSLSRIKSRAVKLGLEDQVHYVEFEAGADGLPVVKTLPLPPKNSSKGFAYIYIAGLGDEVGATAAMHSTNALAKVGAVHKIFSPDQTPILTLDAALPPWAQQFYFLKIDTQGFELKVLNGAKSLLEKMAFEHIQFEFSPWLMRSSKSGDPVELLNLLPDKGGICFDMMGEHNVLPRPSALADYYKSLDKGENGGLKQQGGGRHTPESYNQDKVGPWEDIMCWFPQTGAH